METASPLLSVLVPTFNRAELLKSALYSLAPQVRALDGLVELVVSDNCSTDSTSEVVTWAQQFGPIRYHRNTKNIGACGNVMQLTNELATGTYGWILCDDDIARPDAVSRVLAVLQSPAPPDYIFVNVTALPVQERQAFTRAVSGVDFPALTPAKCPDLADRVVSRFEELIDPSLDDVYLGSVMCSVFRLSVWRQHVLDVRLPEKAFSSLEYTYPHSVILANTMRGRPAYYIGFPCVVTFFGGQEWLGYLPMVVLVRLQELLDLYETMGVDAVRIDKCRANLLGISQNALRAMLFDSRTLGREYFSFSRYIYRNRRCYWELFKLLTAVLGMRRADVLAPAARRLKLLGRCARKLVQRHA